MRWILGPLLDHLQTLLLWGLAFLAVTLITQLLLRRWLQRRWPPRRWGWLGVVVLVLSLVLAPLVSLGCGAAWALGRELADYVGDAPVRTHAAHPHHPTLGRIADAASDTIHEPIDRRRQAFVDRARTLARDGLLVQLALLLSMASLQALAARLRLQPALPDPL